MTHEDIDARRVETPVLVRDFSMNIIFLRDHVIERQIVVYSLFHHHHQRSRFLIYRGRLFLFSFCLYPPTAFCSERASLGFNPRAQG